MSKLDDLMSGLSEAVARAPKRRPRRTRSGDMTPAAQAVLFVAADVKAAEARAALSAKDREEEARYYRRVGRLATLGKRLTAVRRRLEEVEWGSMECARLLTYARVLHDQRAAVFNLPIIASDIADGGRFYRRAKWLGLEVGMLAVDELEVVAGAVELCYVKGQTVANERGELMPTLGAMYRNMKLYYHAQLDRFRRNKSAGVIAVHSIEAIEEAFGTDWFEANSARLENLGYGYADPTEYPAVMVPIDQLPASRAALAQAHSDRQKAARRRSQEAAVRDTLAEGARAPKGYDAASFNADRMAIRVIINGASIGAVAERCNVSEATIVRRLLALEGTLGATVYSTAGSVPVVASVEGAAKQAYPTPDERPTHRHTSWKAPRNGAKASEVLISHK